MRSYALKNIVVPYDFSKSSMEALKAALQIGESPDRIQVIHVIPPLTSTESMIVASEMSEELIAANVEKEFVESIKELDLTTTLNFVALFGDAGSRIAEFANENDAGLIVISSHGRTGLSRILLGSVAERVVRLAPCPVLVLRADTVANE